MKIVVDGLIGAGKSTQVDIIHKTLGVPIVKEPIEEWPLDLFYSDPKRWGFMTQISVLNSFVRYRDSDGIFERSPESTRRVFWKNLVDSGVVTPREDDIFQKLYATLAWQPDVVILIEKDPELCYQHIQKRQQEGDSGVTLEYLHKLKSYYDKFKKDKDVIVVNGNQSIDEVSNEILKKIDTIRWKTAVKSLPRRVPDASSGQKLMEPAQSTVEKSVQYVLNTFTRIEKYLAAHTHFIWNAYSNGM